MPCEYTLHSDGGGSYEYERGPSFSRQEEGRYASTAQMESFIVVARLHPATSGKTFLMLLVSSKVV